MVHTLQRLVIPTLEMPFPRNRHRDQELARRCTKTWAVERRVIPPDLVSAFFDDLKYTDLIGGYYVGAPLPALVAINDFSLWFFAWDDRHDRDIAHRRGVSWSRLRDRLHETLEAPTGHLDDPDPLVGALGECLTRLFEPLSDAWGARFREHFHATIEAYDQEYRNRTTGRIPSVPEYIRLRRHTFGMWVWIDCLELAADCELPAEVYGSEAYLQAGLASQEFSAWYNDLHSMPKELAAGDFHNFGTVLAREYGLTDQEAAEELAQRVAGRIADYQVAEPRVRDLLTRINTPVRIREGTERCLFNMSNWISSVYWFHYESARYRLDAWADPAIPPYIGDPDDHAAERRTAR